MTPVLCHQVISFAGEGKRQEESFVASLDEAQALAGDEGVIETVSSRSGNDHLSNGNGSGSMQTIGSEEVALAEAAG